MTVSEDRMNWVVVTRCERDLMNVKMEFEREYKESLDDWVEVSVDYLYSIC